MPSHFHTFSHISVETCELRTFQNLDLGSFDLCCLVLAPKISWEAGKIPKSDVKSTNHQLKNYGSQVKVKTIKQWKMDENGLKPPTGLVVVDLPFFIHVDRAKRFMPFATTVGSGNSSPVARVMEEQRIAYRDSHRSWNPSGFLNS